SEEVGQSLTFGGGLLKVRKWTLFYRKGTPHEVCSVVAVRETRRRANLHLDFLECLEDGRIVLSACECGPNPRHQGWMQGVLRKLRGCSKGRVGPRAQAPPRPPSARSQSLPVAQQRSRRQREGCSCIDSAWSRLFRARSG